MRTSLAMHIRFVSEEYELNEQSVEVCHFPGKHTAPVICDEPTSTLGSWDFDLKQYPMVLRDNGANIQEAMDLLGEKNMGCVAHTLHLF